jgi:phosphoribosyl-ATP pyrophosphohydrolase
MEFTDIIRFQKSWSERTFGKGKRTEGIVKHIKAELIEILMADNDTDRLEECIDVIILAMDMSWRLGFTADEIERTLTDKQIKNQRREWPAVAISEANQDEPTYHVKGFE